MKIAKPLVITFAGIGLTFVILFNVDGIVFKRSSSASLEGDFDFPEVLSFNEHIQPILSENCYQCHGPDSGSREANLRLDQEQFAFAPAESGKPVILKDDLESSEIIRRLLSENPAERMPPPNAHNQLDPVERALLVQWVRKGAEYEDHWAFIAPDRAAPPIMPDDGWSRTPIDRFVMAKLRAEGLTPNHDADPRVLARRLSLDLTGLLPDPREVEAFAQNPTDHAYEAMVDSLLASPRFGEHRAHYWLDYVRYADTHGTHLDNLRSIWPYRDYVIAAFNDNKPFDTFIREQLAGDLLPEPTLDAIVATGYIRNSLSTNEAGTVPEELSVDLARDRVEAFGSVFMGLTLGCAMCHDHKFDPVTQEDFYRMSAFFNNTTDKVWDANSSTPAPVLRLPNAPYRTEAEAVFNKLVVVNYQIDDRRRREGPELVKTWLAATDGPKPVVDTDLELHLRFDEGEGDVLHNSAPSAAGETFTAGVSPLIWGEDRCLWDSMRMGATTEIPLGGHGDVGTNESFSVGGWIMQRGYRGDRPARSGTLIARMQRDGEETGPGWEIYVHKGSFELRLVHDWPEQAIRVKTTERYPAMEWVHVLFTYDGSARADGVRAYVNGERVAIEAEVDSLAPELSIRTDVPMMIGQRSGRAVMREGRLQDFRFYRRELSDDEVARLPFEDPSARIVAAKPDPADWTALERHIVIDRCYFERKDPKMAELVEQQRALQSRYSALAEHGTPTLVAAEKPTPAYAHVLERGSYATPLNRVEPGTPGFLPKMADGQPNNRAGLAEWVLSPQNPLTSRVIVNRMWQELFGRGIVETSQDFGIMGTRPSHPKLLDWLAVDFREGGWDAKRFYKQLVLSSVYRQSARVVTAQMEKDPVNRYLWRGPRFRMDGEMIRDAALQASGLLVEKTGGPSVRPYQPPGLWAAVAMPISNTYRFRRGAEDELYRRSLYTFWKRQAPPPSLEAFDAPSREVACPRRARTNTPLQALVTMNDPQFVEASKKLAELTIQHAPTTARRLDYLAQVTLARALGEDERDILIQSLTTFSDHFESAPDDAVSLLGVGESLVDPTLDDAEAASWTLMANTFLNLDEYLNK